MVYFSLIRISSEGNGPSNDSPLSASNNKIEFAQEIEQNTIGTEQNSSPAQTSQGVTKNVLSHEVSTKSAKNDARRKRGAQILKDWRKKMNKDPETSKMLKEKERIRSLRRRADEQLKKMSESAKERIRENNRNRKQKERMRKSEAKQDATDKSSEKPKVLSKKIEHRLRKKIRRLEQDL